MMPVFNHTPQIEKQTTEPIVAPHATNTMFGTNCRSIKPQNGPTFHEHVVQGLHTTLGLVLPVLADLSTFVVRNYFPSELFFLMDNPIPFLGC
jgi:hypothetical protein